MNKNKKKKIAWFSFPWRKLFFPLSSLSRRKFFDWYIFQQIFALNAEIAKCNYGILRKEKNSSKAQVVAWAARSAY